MSRKLIFSFITIPALSFALGFCFGATDYHDFLKGVNWTNIVSSMASVSGFSLAFSTYSQWRANKKKDDSYIAAKRYITALNDIKSTLREVHVEYFRLYPAPGTALEPKEIVAKRIQHLDDLTYSLYLAQANLNESKSELAFWKVMLSEYFEKKHTSLNEDLINVNITMNALNSQLYCFYIQEDGSAEDVIRCKEGFNKYTSSVADILDERVLLGFEKVFKFE